MDEAAAPKSLGAADAIHDPAPQTPEPPIHFWKQNDDLASPTIEDTTIPSGDGLESMGLLYEEPNSTYWDQKLKLDGLGAFSHERWGSMECIHFILPNMTSHGQAATSLFCQ